MLWFPGWMTFSQNGVKILPTAPIDMEKNPCPSDQSSLWGTAEYTQRALAVNTWICEFNTNREGVSRGDSGGHLYSLSYMTTLLMLSCHLTGGHQTRCGQCRPSAHHYLRSIESPQGSYYLYLQTTRVCEHKYAKREPQWAIMSVHKLNVLVRRRIKHDHKFLTVGRWGESY